MLEGFGFNVIDVGHGSAYNMPVYLLGELEKHFKEAIVFAWNESNTDIVVVGFISEEEKLELLKALELAKGSESSYEICMRLYE